jgi:hypothetical protein
MRPPIYAGLPVRALLEGILSRPSGDGKVPATATKG